MNITKRLQWILLGVIVLALVVIVVRFTETDKNPETSVFTVTTPPIAILAPHEHDEGDAVSDLGHAVYTLGVATTTEDMWITGIVMTVENGPTSLIHHIQVFSPGAGDTRCPANKMKREYIGLGRDTPRQSIELPPPYGFFVKKGTAIKVYAMLHNPLPPLGTGETYHNVVVKMTATTVPPGSGRTKNVYSMRLILEDREYCVLPLDERLEGGVFTVPPFAQDFVKNAESGTTETRSRFVFPKSGTVLKAGGHLHGETGGKDVTLYLNQSAIATWKSEKKSTVTGETVWVTPEQAVSFAVQKGDELSISATYTNKEAEPVRDAMGIVRIMYTLDE